TQHNNGGSRHSGSSGGSAPVSSGPSAPSGNGGWSANKGAVAVQRARSTEGIVYAWAGGNQYGPTRGVCAGDGAYNDCNVIGFDCSGLAMYAWGPYLSMDHFAASQYSQAGSYHPSFNALAPGDLVFWSYDGTQGNIHHVAIYIGGGQIVEAPESGVPVRTANLYEYGTPFGATRPLT
ncbi:MAG: NlpC/P60 family protein, partial [Jatrophihabitantaceae bacterium]